MMEREKYNCPVEAALSRFGGGKYKAIILYHLIKDGVMRYNELQKVIPRATPKMLSQQLRELEADGLINRKVYPVVPPKTEYSLAGRGQTLAPLINAMYDWGRAYMSGTYIME